MPRWDSAKLRIEFLVLANVNHEAPVPRGIPSLVPDILYRDLLG